MLILLAKISICRINGDNSWIPNIAFFLKFHHIIQIFISLQTGKQKPLVELKTDIVHSIAALHYDMIEASINLPIMKYLTGRAQFLTEHSSRLFGRDFADNIVIFIIPFVFCIRFTVSLESSKLYGSFAKIKINYQ